MRFNILTCNYSIFMDRSLTFTRSRMGVSYRIIILDEMTLCQLVDISKNSRIAYCLMLEFLNIVGFGS